VFSAGQANFAATNTIFLREFWLGGICFVGRGFSRDISNAGERVSTPEAVIFY
jgi:hypothetical protein